MRRRVFILFPVALWIGICCRGAVVLSGGVPDVPTVRGLADTVGFAYTPEQIEAVVEGKSVKIVGRRFINKKR